MYIPYSMGIRNTGWTWWNCHLRGSSIVIYRPCLKAPPNFLSVNILPKGIFEPSISWLLLVKCTSKRAATEMPQSPGPLKVRYKPEHRYVYINELKRKSTHTQDWSKKHQCYTNSKGAATCDQEARESGLPPQLGQQATSCASVAQCTSADSDPPTLSLRVLSPRSDRILCQDPLSPSTPCSPAQGLTEGSSPPAFSSPAGLD